MAQSMFEKSLYECDEEGNALGSAGPQGRSAYIQRFGGKH